MKPWLAILITSIFSAVLIGGGVYWYASSNSNKEKELLKEKISELEKQKSTLGSELVSLQSNVNATEQSGDTAKESSAVTSSWKTYSEGTIGYSVKYPTDYKATDVKSGTVGFGPSNGYEGPAPLTIDAMKPVPSQTLDAYIGKETSDSVLKDCRKAVLSGKSAYECLDLGMTNNYAVVSANNGYIFKLVFNTNKDAFFDNKQALTEIQKMMLDAFKFAK